jgi:hypothetical protein
MHQYVSGQRAVDQTTQDFLRRLRAGEEMPVTYSYDIAYQRKLVEFISLHHPIARAAAQFWTRQPAEELPLSKVVVRAAPDLQGEYYFFVLLFISEGLERSTSLAPIVVGKEDARVNEELGSQFLRLVQTAPEELQNAQMEINVSGFAEAREVAMNYATAERDRREAELLKTNDAHVAARLAAKEQTYRAKRAMIEGYIKTATEPRIRRMREAQLRNVEAKYGADVRDLNRQRTASVTHSLKLAGIMRVDTNR